MLAFPDPNKPVAEQDDIILLALTVLGEAEGEPDLGKYAVAWVVKNRMLLKKKGVREVVMAPWQFSCWNLGEPRRAFLEDTVLKAAKNLPMAVWASCVRASHEVLDGLADDPVEGATHYCTNALWGNDDALRARPRWFSRQEVEAGRTIPTVRIGHHQFAAVA